MARELLEETRLLRAAIKAEIDLAQALRDLPEGTPDQWHRRESAKDEVEKAWQEYDLKIWITYYAE